LVTISHLLAAAKADVSRAHIGSLSWLSALLPAFLSLLAPAAAWGDLYMWTDEKGGTVISNVLPANPHKVKNFELVVKETERSAPQRVPTRTEQVLLDRIDSLERQLRTPQYPPQAQAVPFRPYRESYYPEQPAALPPPPPGYYGSDYPGDYYPWLPSYAYIPFPARAFVSRPRFAFAHSAHSGFVRGPSMHRGRR
jgi:hypothetical protein